MLEDNVSIQEHLCESYKKGVPKFLVALGEVVRANQGMEKLAEEIGFSRDQLEKSLSKQGNTPFSTVVQVLDSIEMTITFVPVFKEF
jgi:probable addiction module antidote protein